MSATERFDVSRVGPGLYWGIAAVFLLPGAIDIVRTGILYDPQDGSAGGAAHWAVTLLALIGGLVLWWSGRGGRSLATRVIGVTAVIAAVVRIAGAVTTGPSLDSFNGTPIVFAGATVLAMCAVVLLAMCVWSSRSR